MKESQLENKTAIATNDYVRMVDENGNSVKIKKDSFMAAIRDALPSIISDGETGGGSVLSIINGALKSRTDANLASVLGGLPYKGDVSSGSPDTATVQGVYYALITFMRETGINSEGLFYVYRPITDTANVHNTCCIQIFVSHDGVLFKRRIYNWDSQIWTEWKDI